MWMLTDSAAPANAVCQISFQRDESLSVHRTEVSGVGVEHEVDRTITDRMRADVNARALKQAHLLPIDLRRCNRITGIAVVGVVEIFVPILKDPRRACAAAAIHEDLCSAGKQPAVAQRCRRRWL